MQPKKTGYWERLARKRGARVDALTAEVAELRAGIEALAKERSEMRRALRDLLSRTAGKA